MPPASQHRHIPGRAILQEVRDSYQCAFAEEIHDRHTKVVIVRFTPGTENDLEWNARMEASRISAAQKLRLFEHLGARPVLHTVPDSIGLDSLATLINDANRDEHVAGIIVQTPAPQRLRVLLNEIDSSKDLDSLGLFAPRLACATADGIVRITEPYLDHNQQVAVVGSSGFVGSGVVALLRDAGHDPILLDVGDDPRRVRDADVVLSTTGVPGLLTGEHLHPGHQLVVDSGFYPTPTGPHGDLAAESTPRPQRITPVPGGVGPIEMAILAERLVQHTVAPELAGWRYLGHEDPQLALTSVEQDVTLTLNAREHALEAPEHGYDNGYELDYELGHDP